MTFGYGGLEGFQDVILYIAFAPLVLFQDYAEPLGAPFDIDLLQQLNSNNLCLRRMLHNIP